MSPQIHCPVCDQEFSTEQSGIALPFCSKRCKCIDRTRWMNEDYGLPYESEHEPEFEHEHESEHEPDESV
ncbi:MAG: DNA gyrase inhibitor YacG [Thermoguttaceae bacterium]